MQKKPRYAWGAEENVWRNIIEKSNKEFEENYPPRVKYVRKKKERAEEEKRPEREREQAEKERAEDKDAQIRSEELHRGPLGFFKVYLGVGGLAVVLYALFGNDLI